MCTCKPISISVDMDLLYVQVYKYMYMYIMYTYALGQMFMFMLVNIYSVRANLLVHTCSLCSYLCLSCVCVTWRGSGLYIEWPPISYVWIIIPLNLQARISYFQEFVVIIIFHILDIILIHVRVHVYV